MDENLVKSCWLGDSHTAREILQQPAIWRELASIASTARPFINTWMNGIDAAAPNRIILCGAGSSAYIGEVLAPYLRRELNIDVEAISTTNIVATPRESLAPQVRTLMISFGRSGDSPESIAAVSLADQLISDCSHLIVTCNQKGQLAASSADANRYVLLLPDETLDKSFAMTSSFTSMLITVAEVFVPNGKALEQTSKFAAAMIEQCRPDIERIVDRSPSRIAFLGSGPLLGIAREAALKMLELSAGGIDCYAETSLGFRHGPKSIVSNRTVNILLPSFDNYTQRYDDDIWSELQRDNIALCNVRLDQLGGTTPYLQGLEALPAPLLGAVYIVFAQILALRTSMACGISADNPCPGGHVNRVVQGVTIHLLADKE